MNRSDLLSRSQLGGHDRRLYNFLYSLIVVIKVRMESKLLQLDTRSASSIAFATIKG